MKPAKVFDMLKKSCPSEPGLASVTMESIYVAKRKITRKVVDQGQADNAPTGANQKSVSTSLTNGYLAGKFYLMLFGFRMTTKLEMMTLSRRLKVSVACCAAWMQSFGTCK